MVVTVEKPSSLFLRRPPRNDEQQIHAASSAASKEVHGLSGLKGVHPFNLTSFRVDRFVYVLIAVVICYRRLNTKVVNIETTYQKRTARAFYQK
jgi:hypothetical protein